MATDQHYQNFVGHLAQVIAEHISSTGGVSNRECEDARRRADEIARESAPGLWTKMQVSKDT